MAPRRRGQIIERGPNTFLLRFFRGTNDAGKRKYHSETFRGTRREAEAKLTELQHLTNTGALPQASSQTCGEFFEAWLAHRPDLAPRTQRRYQYVWRRYFAPELAHLKLQAVTPEGLQRAVGRAHERHGLSNSSLRAIIPILKAGFAQAVTWRKLTYSPADGLLLPKQDAAEKECWTPEELRTFLERTHQSPYHALWVTLATSGLRPGEAIVLTWDDLDGAFLRVTKGLSVDQAGDWAVAPTKTNRMRSVQLPETTLRVLARHKKVLARRALEGGPSYPRSNLMFPTTLGTRPSVSTMNVRFKKELTEAGMRPVTLHSLRHAHATDLLTRGVHPKIVSERLGHASITMTMDTYSHVLPSIQGQTVLEYDQSLQMLEKGWLSDDRSDEA